MHKNQILSRVTVRVWKRQGLVPSEKKGIVGHASLQTYGEDGFYASLWPLFGGEGEVELAKYGWAKLNTLDQDKEEESIGRSNSENYYFEEIDLYTLDVQSIKEKFKSLKPKMIPSIILVKKEDNVLKFINDIKDNNAIIVCLNNNIKIYYKTIGENINEKQIVINSKKLRYLEKKITCDDSFVLNEFMDDDDCDCQVIYKEIVTSILNQCRGPESLKTPEKGYHFLSERGIFNQGFYSCNGLVELLLQAGKINDLVPSYNNYSSIAKHASLGGIGGTFGGALLGAIATVATGGVAAPILFSAMAIGAGFGGLGGATGMVLANQTDNVEGKSICSTPHGVLELVRHAKKAEENKRKKKIMNF